MDDYDRDELVSHGIDPDDPVVAETYALLDRGLALLRGMSAAGFDESLHPPLTRPSVE